jgi:hypothetical protein
VAKEEESSLARSLFFEEIDTESFVEGEKYG